MSKAFSFNISSAAAAELIRQSSLSRTPGLMHLALLTDSFNEGWMHIQLSAGKKQGVPLARTDGITLFAPSDQLKIFKGLNLNYYADLSGGGFLISTPQGAEPSPCGSGFRKLSKVQ